MSVDIAGHRENLDFGSVMGKAMSLCLNSSQGLKIAVERESTFLCPTTMGTGQGNPGTVLWGYLATLPNTFLPQPF